MYIKIANVVILIILSIGLSFLYSLKPGYGLSTPVLIGLLFFWTFFIFSLFDLITNRKKTNGLLEKAAKLNFFSFFLVCVFIIVMKVPWLADVLFSQFDDKIMLVFFLVIFLACLVSSFVSFIYFLRGFFKK